MTVAMVAQEWTISAIAVEFQISRRKVAGCLKGVKPSGKKGNAWLYWMADAAPAIFAADDEQEKLDLTQESARLKKEQADKTHLEVEVLKGNLIPGEVVSTKWGDFIANARAKLARKGADAIVLNMASAIGAEETEITILLADGDHDTTFHGPKDDAARLIVATAEQIARTKTTP